MEKSVILDTIEESYILDAYYDAFGGGRSSKADTIENYFDYFFNEGVPRYPKPVIRFHSNRIERVFWDKWYSFNTSEDWWGFEMLSKAALMESALTLRCYGPDAEPPF